MRLALLLFLLTLWGCAPAVPKGFFCWQDKGYMVCQFVPADKEENPAYP